MRLPFSLLLGLLLAPALVGWPPTGSGAAAAQPGAAAFAQPDSTALRQIEQAFRAGDAEALLDGAAERIDVVIFGKGSSYSRAQAGRVLGGFFRRYPPKQVVFEQEVLADDRRSMIGRYWVAEGEQEPVGVSVRLRARGSRWQLRAVRIERGSR